MGKRDGDPYESDSAERRRLLIDECERGEHDDAILEWDDANPGPTGPFAWVVRDAMNMALGPQGFGIRVMQEWERLGKRWVEAKTKETQE